MTNKISSKEKFAKQISLHQIEEDLRKTRVQMAELEIQLRRYQQEMTKANMNVKIAEEQIKKLKSKEFELGLEFARQKRDVMNNI